jgi:hypothetical protein
MESEKSSFPPEQPVQHFAFRKFRSDDGVGVVAKVFALKDHPDLKGKSDLEIATILCFHQVCSTRVASVAFSLSQSQVSRGLKSLREGRMIGRSGGRQFLWDVLEDELVTSILNSDPACFPTKDDLCEKAEKIHFSLGIKRKVVFTRNWVDSFIHRHPQIKTLF